MDNSKLCEMLFAAACPNNEVIYDEAGNPNIMVFIPKFRMNQVITNGSDKIHPAFIVNGVERDGFYISKYQNSQGENGFVSLPKQVPFGGAGYVDSIERCEKKGRGWHLTTIQEWGAIALWCKRNGYLPYGNNDHGKDKRENVFRATPATSDEKGAKTVLTGTGPLSWSHDKSVAGIWDMNGNLSEWVGGIRFVFGELQVLPNNDAADILNLQTADSDKWRAISATTGEYIIPDGKGTTEDSIKADYFTPEHDHPLWGSRWRFTSKVPESIKPEIRRCDVSFITCDDTIAPAGREMLYAFGLIFNEPYYDTKEQYAYLNNGLPEAFMYRGGYWGSGAFAGIFCWSCSTPRGYTYEGNGFRSCYVKLD